VTQAQKGLDMMAIDACEPSMNSSCAAQLQRRLGCGGDCACEPSMTFGKFGKIGNFGNCACEPSMNFGKFGNFACEPSMDLPYHAFRTATAKGLVMMVASLLSREACKSIKLITRVLARLPQMQKGLVVVVCRRGASAVQPLTELILHVCL